MIGTFLIDGLKNLGDFLWEIDKGEVLVRSYGFVARASWGLSWDKS